MVKNFNIEEIRFDGGRLCLNYINTIHNRFEKPLNDYIQSVNDLIQWAFMAKVIGSELKINLGKYAQKPPDSVSTFFIEAIKLRENLYRMFLHIARDMKISDRDMSDFNELISHSFSRLKLTHSSTGYAEEWDYPADSFYLISAPILKDAYDLLLYGEQSRIRECPNCGWLFYDSSKNGTRRWCSMKTCGSNVKALNWYHKHKTDRN